MAPQQQFLLRRVIAEIWNSMQLDVADELFAPDYVNHGGLIVDLVHGPEAIKTSVAFFRRAFPRLHISIDALDCTDGGAVLHWSAYDSPPAARATAAGSSAGLTGVTQTREAGGQIQESWTVWDREAAFRWFSGGRAVVPGDAVTACGVPGWCGASTPFRFTYRHV
jgi:hypothetical protein